MVLSISTPAAVLVLTAAVLVSATGGAVAGSLVTGAQVKDGSLTGKDIKDGSLKTSDLSKKTRTALTGPPGTPGTPGAPGLSGLQTAFATLNDVAPGQDGTLSKNCPTGTRPLSATAFWSDSTDAVQVAINNEVGAIAYYDNETGGEDDLLLQVRCATAAP